MAIYQAFAVHVRSVGQAPVALGAQAGRSDPSAQPRCNQMVRERWWGQPAPFSTIKVNTNRRQRRFAMLPSGFEWVIVFSLVLRLVPPVLVVVAADLLREVGD